VIRSFADRDMIGVGSIKSGPGLEKVSIELPQSR
jgi:hypothetical protein